jgi:hypothetical protein
VTTLTTRRTLTGASIAILLAMSVLVLPSRGNAATPAERATATQLGADWLAGQFTSEGYIADVNGDPDFANTVQATLSLAVSASNEATFDAAIAYLEAHVDDYVNLLGSDDSVGALAYLLLLADAAGVPGTDFGGNDLVDRLEATLGLLEPGLYGATSPTFDGVYRQGLALMGLASAGVTPDPAAVSWLTDQQCSSGGWDAYRADTSAPCGPPDPVNFIGPDSNSTALAVQGLAAIGADAPADPLPFLDDTQGSDGGWAFIEGLDVDPNSTALVIQALVAVGEDPEAAPWVEGGSSPYDSLLAWQITTGDAGDIGAFASAFSDGLPDLFASQQGVWGVAGAVFPLGPVDFGGGDGTSTSTTSVASTSSGGGTSQPATAQPQFAG